MGARVATSHRIAGATLAALIVGGMVVAPTAGAVAAPSDQSEALASVLDSSLLALPLAGEGTATSGNPSAPGADTADIDATVLAGLLGVNLPGLTVPVIRSGANNGILDLGGAAGAGVLNAYTVADSASHAVASAGAVGADGAVNLAATQNPATIGSTRVDVTALIGQLGLGPATTGILDQLSLELGALASRAEQTAPGAATRDYRLAGGRLNLHSPTIAALSGTVTTAVNGVQGTLNAALGTTGVVGSVVSAVNIDANVLGLARLRVGGGTAGATVNLAPTVAALTATDLVSSNGLVTLNLSTGSVRVDVARLLKGPGATDLNGLPANTEVLSPTTITAIVAGVADILNNLDDLATTLVTTALQGTTLTVTLPARLDLLAGIGTSNPTITVQGTLAQFAAGTATVAITGNLLGLPLAPLTGVVTTLLGPVLLAPLTGVVTALIPSIAGGLGTSVATLAATALGLISPVVTNVLSLIARITINEQTNGDLGASSATVRALAVDLIPGLGPLAEVNLGSSTVRAAGAAPPITPTLDATPDPVQAGGTVTVASGGWVPGSSVTVVARDSANAQVGTPHVLTADGAGNLTDTIALPTTTPTGALTVTGTSADGTVTDTVQVTAATPPPVLTATPPTVSVGDTVAVATSGWPAGAAVTVRYTDSAGATVATHPLVASGTGALTDSLVVPPGTPLGPLTATATGPGPVAPSGTVTVVAPTTVPTVDASPSTLRPGDDLTVAGTGWPADQDVTLQFTDADGGTFTATTTADGTGAFTADVIVPGGTPTGALDIVATSGAATATDQVQVTPDAAISARQDTRYPGETVDVDGSGWTAGPVTVVYTAADGTVLATTTPTADGSGAFTDSLTLPAGVAPGQLQITASRGADSAADTVQVLATPTLTVAPPVVAPGGTITATGGGWPAGAVVTLVWRDSAGTIIATTTQTAGPGGALTDSLLVPPTTPLGPLTVVATEPGGGTASALVSVELPPTLIAGPADLVAGQTVSVASSGWPAGAPIGVTYTDADGAQVGSVHAVTANGAGAFTDSVVVPVGTALGTLTVTAVGPAGRTASDSVTVRPDPTLEASPASVPQGGTIAVTGDDWIPGTVVQVVYTAPDGTPLATHPVTVASDGSVDDELVVPVGTAPGTVTVTATDPDGNARTDTVVLEAAPTLTASPGTVTTGQTVTVTGSGWPASVPVEVTYTDADGDPIGAPHTVTTSGTGALSDTLVVPAGTVPGTIAIAADDGNGRTGTASVTLQATPTLEASPASLPQGGTVAVTSDGWVPGTVVTVVYTAADGTPLATNTVTAGAGGDFTDSLTLPSPVASGALTVTATGGGVSATDAVTVEAAPIIQATPSTVAPGQTLTVTGSGWPAGSTLEVVYTDADGDPIGAPHPVTTNGTGGFTDTLVVPGGTPVGTITITADDGDGRTATTTAALVLNPTLVASPASIQSGDAAEVAGTGWPASTPVTVTWTDAAGTVLATDTVTTSPTGALADSLDPVTAAVGTLTVQATAGAITRTAAIQVAAGPAVAVAQDTVVPGAAIDVAGSGWTPNGTVDLVYLGSDGAQIGGTRSVPTDASGALVDTLTVPLATPAGALTVTATQGGDTATDTVTVLRTPAIEAGPASVQPGDTVTVTGTGWPTGTPVTVVYTDGGGVVIGTHTVLTDGTGGFTDTIGVPTGTPPGTLTVTATGPGGVSATDNVTVAIGPSIAADRETGLSDAIIRADGSGWAPGALVQLSVTDATGDVLAMQTVTAGPAGTFSSLWDLPGIVDPGPLTITATSGGVTVSDAVIIEARVLSPGDRELVPGDELPVQVDGWPWGIPVTIVYTDASGTVIDTNTVVGDAGGWAIDRTVLPASTALGALRIRATDQHGAVLDEVVDVVAPAAAGPGAGTGGGPAGSAGNGLATTGSDVGGPALGALLLVLLGLAGMLAARRVRRRSNAGS